MMTRSLFSTIRLPGATFTRFEKVESLMITLCPTRLNTAPGRVSSVL